MQVGVHASRWIEGSWRPRYIEVRSMADEDEDDDEEVEADEEIKIESSRPQD